jgi:hypothetical protein
MAQSIPDANKQDLPPSTGETFQRDTAVNGVPDEEAAVGDSPAPGPAERPEAAERNEDAPARSRSNLGGDA